MRPGRYGFEAPANPVEREQRARGDAEISSVKAELALLFALGKHWKARKLARPKSPGESIEAVVFVVEPFPPHAWPRITLRTRGHRRGNSVARRRDELGDTPLTDGA